MNIKMIDVKSLIERAKRNLDKDDPSYQILKSYIKDAEKMLPDIKGKLTSAQKEIYDRLEAAVGL